MWLRLLLAALVATLFGVVPAGRAAAEPFTYNGPVVARAAAEGHVGANSSYPQVPGSSPEVAVSQRTRSEGAGTTPGLFFVAPRGAPCNSFVPGTLVLMADGSSKPIEDVGLGDEVWAADPVSGEEGPRAVTQLITGHGEKTLVDIQVDGDVVTATDRHPIWVDGDGVWVDAVDVAPGDYLLDEHGVSLLVDDVEVRHVANQTVHNLSVDDLHTFFVLAGDDPILTHNNTCGAGDASSGARPAGPGPGGGDSPAAARGRQAHADADYGPGFENEFTLPSGRRADGINFDTREVVELKPNNPRAIRAGERQVGGYVDELNQEFPGQTPWTGRVETHEP